MGLILCPECSAKISDRACMCPHCGFQSEDSSRPISEQDRFEPIPMIQWEIDESGSQRNYINWISPDDNKQIFDVLGSWEKVKRMMPAFADAIQEVLNMDTMLIADIDDNLKKMIKDGVVKLVEDKDGRKLGILRRVGDKEFVKQIRLKEIDLPPQLVQPLNNIAMQAAMNEILDEIKIIGDAIQEVHIELQNDRLALVESARYKLLQANKINNLQLKQTATLAIIQSATDARQKLIKGFEKNLKAVEEQNKKIKAKELNNKAKEAMEAILYIANSVQIECEGYAILGEYDASKESLKQFREFILDNKLEDRNTMLKLNEALDEKKIHIVNEFSQIATKIMELETDMLFERKDIKFIEGSHDEN